MTKRTNEHTSKRIAKIAGRILAIQNVPDAWYQVYDTRKSVLDGPEIVKWEDIRALAASALTQTQDHAERETLRKGKRKPARSARGKKRVRK